MFLLRMFHLNYNIKNRRKQYVRGMLPVSNLASSSVHTHCITQMKILASQPASQSGTQRYYKHFSNYKQRLVVGILKIARTGNGSGEARRNYLCPRGELDI